MNIRINCESVQKSIDSYLDYERRFITFASIFLLTMARPQKCKKLCNPPKMEGFKPYGMAKCNFMPVILKYEEFESIRLVDYDLLSQDFAAEKMNISRPTFTRIYNRALKTIAKAFVEGKAIEIEGGNYEMDKEWYRCRKCFKLIEGLENHTKCKNCTLYGGNELIKLN